jgi:hypothetical protein
MDVHQIPKQLSISDFPVGFGGCRNNGTNFDCCEYNITIFDEKSGESIHEFSDQFVKLHHCSISESNVGVLKQIENLTILNDDQWQLRMFLDKIRFLFLSLPAFREGGERSEPGGVTPV